MVDVRTKIMAKKQRERLEMSQTVSNELTRKDKIIAELRKEITTAETLLEDTLGEEGDLVSLTDSACEKLAAFVGAARTVTPEVNEVLNEVGRDLIFLAKEIVKARRERDHARELVCENDVKEHPGWYGSDICETNTVEKAMEKRGWKVYDVKNKKEGA